MDEGSIQPGKWRPQGAKILLRVDTEFRERVKRCAASDGISMNQFCIAALESWCQATEELKCSPIAPRASATGTSGRPAT